MMEWRLARPGVLHGLLNGAGWSEAKLRAYQERRLRELVWHAWERVPWYRSQFERAGLKPGDVRTLADLHRIPLTSRSDLQCLRPEDAVASGYRPEKLVAHATSGSSGAPLIVRRTPLEDRLLQACRLRVLFRLGMRWRDRRAAVVSETAAPGALWEKAGLLRYREVSCLLAPEQILARLRALRPDILRGYPGTLAWLGTEMSEQDRASIRPRLVTTDSETLTEDLRGRIREAFEAPVVDFYDSNEFNMIAWECPAGLYHLSGATVLGEVVRDGRAAAPGETGEFVGTALHSWAMPFLRYRQGDMVAAGTENCACGLAGATLRRIEGRVGERFPLAGGKSIHPYALIEPLMRAAPWLRQYQMVQEGLDRLRVRVVRMAEAPAAAECLATVQRVVEQSAEGRLRVEADLVERIEPEANGKFRPWRSLGAGAARDGISAARAGFQPAAKAD